MDMKVAIIGAGIGGLTLANALKRKSISFQVYERDESVSSRTQGYSLGLKEPGGITALKNFDLLKKAESAGRPASNFSFITDKGKVLMSLEPDGPGSQGYTLGVT
jgi:2-polyprenyl-6-methoxyphenol hydroxylase-like FAD-dependent oxidoreductase